MSQVVKSCLFVVLVAIISLFVFWAPFLLKMPKLWDIEFNKNGMSTIVQNFDGLNFLVVAKSLYDPSIIRTINTKFLTGNEPIYFAAHFPLFALLIKGLATIVSYPNALIISVLIGNLLFAIGLYVFFLAFMKKPNIAFFLSMIALFLPARILSVRGVGSNEPLFIFLVLTSLVAALKEKHWYAAILGSLAVLTRSPGILLFAAYFLAWLFTETKHNLGQRISKFLPYLLMPLTLVALFLFYAYRYNSLFAYFQSGDNLHLFFPPFQIFSNMQTWISDMWREDIIYLYLAYGVGILAFRRNIKVNHELHVFGKAAAVTFGIIYGILLTFISHRDIARYALPIAPIAILGYAPWLINVPKKWKWIALILLVPIYLLGWQFVVGNVQPINDWSAFL